MSEATGRNPAVEGDQDTRFFGQPWGLANLFGVEMWERFSFYGMQGILIYYLYYTVAEGGLGIAEACRHEHRRRLRRHGVPLHDPRAPGSRTGSSAPNARCSTAPS